MIQRVVPVFIDGQPSSARLLAESAPSREQDLDVVRGLAILLAMGWHLNGAAFDITIVDVLWPGRAIGWAGADVFFVLSGFLVGRLILRESLRTGSFIPKRFLLRRAFKLWPVLYTFLALMTLAFPWGTFLVQIGTHTQNYFRTPVATHLWSLAVEEHFYLSFALLIPLWLRRGGRLSMLFWAVIALLIAAPLLRCAAVAMGVSPLAVQVQTQFRIDALALGVGLAGIHVYRPEIFSRLCAGKAIAAIACVGAFAFIAWVDKASPLGMTVGFTVSYLAGGALLLLIYKSGIDRWAPATSSALAFLGIYSYGIYIWHVPASRAVEALSRFAGWPRGVTIGCAYAASIAAGWCITRLLERPAMALRDRLLPA